MNDTRSTAEPLRMGQLEIRYLQHAGGGHDMGCFEMTVPPGSNVPPPHSHPGNEELIYVLEGVLRCTVDGITRDLSPGESIGTPRGAVHAFSNPHGAVARALVINTPDIGVQYFIDVAAIINAGGPPDRAKVAAAMQRYGLVPAAPPSASAAGVTTVVA